MFRDGKWVPAVEPIHTDKPDIAGVGLCMSFAYGLVNQFPSMNVGLVATAVGGTPLSRWVPEGDLYQNAVAVCKDALSQGGQLKGILWHQGEGDTGSDENANSYARRLHGMFTTLRDELDAPNVPIVAGELGPFLKERSETLQSCTRYAIVNAQLHSLRTMLPFYDVVSSEGLSDNGDLLHFNAKSLRTFGERYLAAYLKLI